jgi:hypothetical protein
MCCSRRTSEQHPDVRLVQEDRPQISRCVLGHEECVRPRFLLQRPSLRFVTAFAKELREERLNFPQGYLAARLFRITFRGLEHSNCLFEPA